MGLGIWLLVDSNVANLGSLVAAASNSGLLRASAILILSTGCAVFLISLLGVIGAYLENKTILGIYIALLVIVFCAEITGAVLAIAFKDWLLDGLDSTLQDSLNQPYYVPANTSCNPSSTGKLWDYVQFKLNCCGIYQPPHSGYERLTYLLRENCSGEQERWNLNVPVTCCTHNSSVSYSNVADNYDSLLAMVDCNVINSQGCVDKIESWIVYYSPVLIGIGFGVAFLQLIGFIFAVCVCANSPRGRGYKQQN